MRRQKKSRLRVVGLFAGIGGLEKGFARAGHTVVAFAENDPYASRVLAAKFKSSKNLGDIRTIDRLPRCDVLTAGFPCQDLSPAGGTAGIHGKKSRLVSRMFSLLERAPHRPEWILLENVPFLLSLRDGRGMKWLIKKIESLGYKWAYRVLDSKAFGLPQRRKRLFILASLSGDPSSVLFRVDERTPTKRRTGGRPHGFYWTEGNRGVGWAEDAIPPLKCSSTVGIISPPAIWIPRQRSIVLPTIADAEALQGFPRGWTKSAEGLPRGNRIRWRLVGNAVSVPIATWIGRRICRKFEPEFTGGMALPGKSKWPSAAWGEKGRRYAVDVDGSSTHSSPLGILKFISRDASSLSHRATQGFLTRLLKSNLRVPKEFIADLRFHAKSVRRKENRLRKEGASG